MNNRKFRSILESALEQEISSSEIQMWPAIKAYLVAGNHLFVQQGEKMNPRNRPQGAAIVAVAIVLLMTLALVTPQGRAFAQNALRFFTRTENDTYYSPPLDLTFEDTTPFHAQCGTSLPPGPTCSVEEIRSMVPFEVKELGTVPEGMRFVGSTGGPDFVELKYEYADRRLGSLHVAVEAIGNPSSIGTGIVAQSANVEPVQIGNLPGEYYTGILFQDEQGNVTWQPDDPMQTLRWEDGGSTYTIFYYSTRYPLTKEDLIKLAESMTLEPVSK